MENPILQYSSTPLLPYIYDNALVFFHYANQPDLFWTQMISSLDLFAFFFKPHVLIGIQIKCRCIHRFAGN